jgi:hypothetical protein
MATPPPDYAAKLAMLRQQLVEQNKQDQAYRQQSDRQYTPALQPNPNWTPKKADGGQVNQDVMRLALMNKGGKPDVRPTVFDDKASRRNEKIEAAARALVEGEMKQKAYEKLVAKEKPVSPYDFVPEPATNEKAMEVLLDRQKQNWRSHENWPAGHRVGLRLDIPAYERHGVWVNSIHDESGGQDKFPTSYGPVSSVRNAEFQGNPHKGIKVATGEQSKAPFAKIMGELEHIDEAKAIKHMQKYLKHPDYRQVGYDPRRHGDFYDRETMEPITHSEHVVQIGPLVLAKKPKYGKRTMYKDGSRVDAMAGYKDPKSTKIADWKWRKMQDVRKDMPITEVPDYIQRGYGEFMNEQNKRAEAGQLSPRDLLKAFTITQSSIGRGGLPHSTATKTGMKLPNTGGEVRPEGAFAEWLGSPMGQKYLDMAARGEIDPRVLKDIQEKFAPFGKQNQLADQMIYAAEKMPEMAKSMNQAVTGSTEDYRDWAEQMKGIAGAKSGFVGSMIGRGDLPTLDARQLNLHTLPANVGIGSIMNRGKGKGAREAVDRLIARQKAMGLKLDPALAKHYQHLAHHAVWDKVGENQTTHDDIIKAMRGYAEGGVTHAHHLDIEERPL